MNLRLLMVDDDRAFSALAAAALHREGHEVVVARSLYEAREALGQGAPDVVLLDRRLPDGDGLEFLTELKGRVPQAAALMITAHGDIASAVGAVRQGAVDYLTKPIELAELVLKIERAGSTRTLRDRLERAEADLSRRRRLVPPQSPPMRLVLDMLDRVARTPRSPVLLLGETGTGKEILARYFHTQAFGDEAPFVQLNCAALPETTFESELFGHERGAFTDARSARRGLVEVAQGGTLFLDEVGELPLALQAKMLTFLDHGRFRRLGGTVELHSTARIVAATNRDLEKLAAQGAFRDDLWFRLSVFSVRLPPLRERRDDILPLAEGLLQQLAPELGRRGARLSPMARERLLAYGFPGNVRELRSILERALVLEPADELQLGMIDTGRRPVYATVSGGGPPSPSAFCVADGPIPLEELEARYARHVLGQLGGKKLETAQALGISYPTLVKRLTAGAISDK